MLQTINNKIQQGFSKSASSYDRFSSLHREIADKLLAQIPGEPKPSALLDVGCGTGYLTLKAQEHFPEARVIGLDFSQEMLKIAAHKHEGISWILANGNNLPFSDGSLDALVSNLAYQWAGDIGRAFGEARRVLSSDGVLACTLFGHSTCQELFQSLDEVKSGALRFTRLPDEVRVKQGLAISGFKNYKVDSEQIKIEFKDMHELISWLKSIGANNLPREGYVGKGSIARAAAIYRERFSFRRGVAATFEVIGVYAKK